METFEYGKKAGKKKKLGRGLNTLLGDTSSLDENLASQPPVEEVKDQLLTELSPDNIAPMKGQPRKDIDQEKIAELSPELFLQLFEEMSRHEILPHLSKIQTPTLVIGGDKDMVIPCYLQKMLAQEMENSELYIVFEGSHVPQVDFPDIINKRVSHFLTQL